MNKAEFIEAVAEKASVTKKEATVVVNAFQDVVTTALKSGDKVSLIGFGTFESVKRAAKQGKNPQTGEKISIPEKNAPKFKPGKSLKDALN